METLTGLRVCTIFIRVSPAKGISREERGTCYVFPCIFPILLEQVNGKRALPRLPFVFHEMSSSRIESLYRDMFARCVIRSLPLLVKEPSVAVAFSRCKRRYISKGARYRWSFYTQDVSESGTVALGPMDFSRFDQASIFTTKFETALSFPIFCWVSKKNNFAPLSIIVLTIQYLQRRVKMQTH